MDEIAFSDKTTRCMNYTYLDLFLMFLLVIKYMLDLSFSLAERADSYDVDNPDEILKFSSYRFNFHQSKLVFS